MAQQFQFRGGAAALWAEVNPILADREMGIETDTRKFKIGDSVTHWNNLSYATQGNSGTIEIGTIETVDPGTPASVVNVGTPTAAKLNFKIPKGDIGVTGFTGQAFSGDFHDQLTAGYYYTAAVGQANAPNNTEKFMLIIAVGETANYVIHKAIGFTTGKQYINVKTAGTWIGWALLTTAADVEAFSQTVRMWQKNMKYVAGDIAYSSNLPSWARVECTVAGTTAATEPAWPTKPSRTVTDGGVTWTVRDVRNGRIVGVENHIASGRKITSTSGLVANLSAGKECINGYISELDANAVTLPARKVCLICDKADGSTVVVEGKYPIDYIDDNTVGFWIFNQAAGVNVPNSAVGKSAIAVANDLIPVGGVTSVDGHCDHSAKLESTSGYYKGSNATNFPIGAAERELSIGYNLNALPAGTMHLCGFGTATTNGAFFIAIDSTGQLCFSYASSYYNTGYYVDKGKKLTITFKYDGTKLYTYANGTPLGNPFTIALTTGSSILYVNNYCVPQSVYVGPMTVDYVELRNKMRPEAKTSEIANKLMLPCFYTKSAADYPTIPVAYAADCHEYRMDETNGTAVTDRNTTSPLNGVATGAPIVESDLGLGNARKFSASTDKVSLGTFACGSVFSFAAVLNVTAYSSMLWSNRPSGGASGVLIWVNASGYIELVNATTAYALTSTPIKLGSAVLVGISINGTTVKVYIDAPNNPVAVATISTLNTTANAAFFGYDPGSSAIANHVTMDYCLFGNFELTQADMQQIYNSLMKTGRRSIIDDDVPVNAVAVAYAKTGSNGVIEYNDLWPMYGRREGATGGNRKQFLPWQPFSGAQPLKWANPFGTGKYKVEYHWAEDSKGTNEARCYSYFAATSYFGVLPTAAAAGYNDAQNITASTAGGGVTVVNGLWKTTGYIGCYAEMLEDYTGVV